MSDIVERLRQRPPRPGSEEGMSNLTELFDRDPLHLSEQDLSKIVARLREYMSQYELGVKPAKAEKPKKSTKTQDLLKSLGLE